MGLAGAGVTSRGVCSRPALSDWSAGRKIHLGAGPPPGAETVLYCCIILHSSCWLFVGPFLSVIKKLARLKEGAK